jgi:hypothetical protein
MKMKNRKKEIEQLMDELEARQQNYGDGPPEDSDIPPRSLADGRIERRRRMRSCLGATEANKLARRRQGDRWLLQHIISKLLQQARDIAQLSGLPGGPEFAEEVQDLINSRVLC